MITGAARRIGYYLALTAARAGADIIIHHANSPEEASQAASEIERLGQKAWVLQADFRSPVQAESLVKRAGKLSNLYAVINNAAIFEALELHNTSLTDWQRHLDINLTAPFLISREFASHLPAAEKGRIINILDWRALRPAADHFPYTISKAALAAMTHALAVSLAPRITVNGLAMGAILPPSDNADTSSIVKNIPAGRWANVDEVGQAVRFFLEGPEYITGEIMYLDGGRHLL